SPLSLLRPASKVTTARVELRRSSGFTHFRPLLARRWVAGWCVIRAQLLLPRRGHHGVWGLACKGQLLVSSGRIRQRGGRRAQCGRRKDRRLFLPNGVKKEPSPFSVRVSFRACS